MRNTLHRFLRWFPLWAFGTALVIIGLAFAASQTWPSSRTRVEERWDQAVAIVTAPWFFVAAFIVVVAWAYFTWLTRPRGSLVNYDDVGEWSVSVDLGVTGTSSNGRDLTRYVRQMCKFTNLSAIQRRILDIEITLPSFNPNKNPLRLKSTASQSPPASVWPENPERYSPNLQLPIRLEPNEVLEGQIEFVVPPGVGDDFDILRDAVVIREARSQLSKRLSAGQVYDARKRRAYRGRLGEPFPIWRARLRSAWEWLRYRRWRKDQFRPSQMRAQRNELPPLVNERTQAEDSTTSYGEAFNERARDRIPFVRIRDLAPAYGLGLGSHDPEPFNVAYRIEGALRQAAVNGNLKVWGRKYRGEGIRGNEPTVPKEADHFKDFDFAHGNLHYQTANREAKTNTIRQFQGVVDVTYYDLELSLTDTQTVLSDVSKGEA